MSQLIDVVNFNADASCLRAQDWLRALEGGESSQMFQWLELFVTHKKKVSIGLVGATVADMAHQNPETIALVNAHPDIFEIILRPFSHDIGLLRTPAGFRVNVTLGKKVLEDQFDIVTSLYLPPEFMLTNEQICQLSNMGIRGVFINPQRFAKQVRQRIPECPYWLEGILGAKIRCIPFTSELTTGYLDSLHSFCGARWNEEVGRVSTSPVTSWRDGESWLFVPDGLEREQAWLKNESSDYQRIFLRDAFGEDAFFDSKRSGGGWQSYPVHSFADWLKEFRMFGYLHRLLKAEGKIQELSRSEMLLWLQAINSDVLSAVEKESPVIRICTKSQDNVDLPIYRSERGCEGEEYLALLERYHSDPDVNRYLETSQRAHMVKYRCRLSWLEGYEGDAVGETDK